MNEKADDRSGDLVVQWRNGDQQAAAELFRRYADRLVALARARLPRAQSRRIDPEDVVQSVYRSFFVEARDGRYELMRGGDLWRLLVTITLHKLRNQVKHTRRAKRAVDREQAFGSEDSLLGVHAQALARSPSMVEALAVADELEYAMRGLEPVHRRMFEMRLQGHDYEEIADATGRCERTVRRVLERVKQQLMTWYATHSNP